MPIVLSIFGVAAPQGTASFCYAQLRTAGTLGRYARPSLPASAVSRELSRSYPEQRTFELQVWDTILGKEESLQVEADLASGSLRVPSNCPIQPGTVLTGAVFADTLLLERGGRVSVEGAGALSTRGFAVAGGAENVIAALQIIRGGKAVGAELTDLLALMDREAGLRDFVVATRRLGVVEHLTRRLPDASEGPIKAGIVKPDIRSQEPCREIVLTRSPGAPAVALRVALTAKSGDAVILHQLLAVPAERSEVRLDAGGHVTSLLVSVFDERTGDLMDQEELTFIQQIGFSLVGRGATDILPPPFRAAQAASDLTERPRINTGAFSMGGGDRSGGFDALRRNSVIVDALVGARDWRAESRFFPASPHSQIEVIRWIKQCIESPDVAEAFLIDPYLGSEALQRVVLRQGNESVKLTIVVSPADVDPDADSLDTTCTPGRHVENLIRTADALTGALCGDIEIIHLQRGGGTRQAFHDRHLGLVGRNGVPRVFLLSNSLSKAAGDWPFTVAEVDTLTSWRIASYVAGFKSGDEESGRQIQATPVWKSTNASVDALPTQPPDAFQSALWSAYMDLSDLNTRGEVYDRTRTDQIVDRLVLALPSSFDDQALADAIVESVGGRDHFLPAIIQRLSESPNHAQAATLVEEALLQRLFDRLTSEAGLFGHPEPLPLLRFAGEALSRRPAGTYLVRDRMNPSVDAYACSLEIGRLQEGAIKRLIAGLCLVLIGLELVQAGGSVPIKFRSGIAVDYVHLLGRLLRSWVSRDLFGRGKDDLPGADLAREAVCVARTLAAVPDLELGDAMGLVLGDPLVPPELLTSGARSGGLPTT